MYTVHCTVLTPGLLHFANFRKNTPKNTTKTEKIPGLLHFFDIFFVTVELVIVFGLRNNIVMCSLYHHELFPLGGLPTFALPVRHTPGAIYDVLVRKRLDSRDIKFQKFILGKRQLPK